MTTYVAAVKEVYEEYGLAAAIAISIAWPLFIAWQWLEKLKRG